MKRAELFPVECVVRGYLAGSGWKEYKAPAQVCGIKLPAGLQESDLLARAHLHSRHQGRDRTRCQYFLRATCERSSVSNWPPAARPELADLQAGRRYARQRGIIIADTKFEFGHFAQGIILADEVLTPDSSRFWPADHYQPGRGDGFFDKQFLRDYLEEIRWNKTPPAPALPPGSCAADKRKVSRGIPSVDGTRIGKVSLRAE